ncbi:MAG: hypothetical protein QNK25_14610, partial [Desulfobacterales bacterium]|nr:hypothetical protein [Desulfobacterales bacterium]
LHVINRVIRHCRDQVEIGIVIEWVDKGRVAGQIRWLPLACVTTHEPVEIVKAQTDWPLIKRPDLTDLEIGRIVILAEPGRYVAVPLEDSGNRRLILGHDAVVARVAGRQFRYRTRANLVMVTPRDERRPRRRAHRRGMEVGVAETLLGDTVHCRRGYDAPEGAGHTIARVVGHDQKNVWCTLRRHHARLPVGSRINNIAFNLAAERCVGRRRKLFPRDSGRGTG